MADKLQEIYGVQSDDEKLKTFRRVGSVDSLGNPISDDEAERRRTAPARTQEANRKAAARNLPGKREAAATTAKERAATASQIAAEEGYAPQPASLKDAAQASMRARGLSPGQEVAAAEGFAADEYEQAGMSQLGMLGAEQVGSRLNKEYGITKDYVKTSREITARQYGAQAAVDEAQVAHATATANELDEQARRQEMAIVDMRSRQFHQEEMEIEAQERTEQAYGLVQKTVQRMADAPAIDPNRWWASRSNGQKVAATFAMLGRGMAGGNPIDAIQGFINADIDAQKSTFQQLQATSAAAHDAASMARGLYADVRNQVGDERMADEIMRIARNEQLKTELEAMSTKTAIPSIRAVQEQARLQLEQVIADRTLILGKLAAHNVKRKAVITPAYRYFKDPQTGQVIRVPLGGAGAKEAAKYNLEESSKSRGDARKLLGEETIEGAKARNKAAESQGESDLAERKFKFEQKAKLAGDEKTKYAVAALKAGQIYLERYAEDVPGRTEGTIFGVGVRSPIGSKAKQRERAALDNFAQWAAGALTGANVSDRQQQFLDSMLTGDELSGDQIREGVRDLMTTLEAIPELTERALEDEPAAEHRRVAPDQLPDYAPSVRGRGPINRTPEEDAEDLGGTLR